jgi:uncharacterized protein YdiU (UPF0061 family)
MDEQQQRRVNEAAEQFAGAVVESYRTLAARGVSAQELNAELTQQFFNRVINNLRTQAEDTREMTQALAEQQQRGQEASQTLTQESVGAYMNFVNSMFSYLQAAPEAIERGTREAQSTPTTEAPPERQAGAELPLEDYDSLTVQQISERLDDLSVEEIRQLRAYEAENKSRSTLLGRLDERIEAGSSS